MDGSSMNKLVLDTASRYAILGCGSVGYGVATSLDEQEKDVIIFDRDESRVEALRDQDLNAVNMDITDPEVAEEASDRPVVLILTSFIEDNKTALKNLREENDDQYVIVRASDPVSQEELYSAGADFVINPPQVIAESALRALETGELEHRVSNLTSAIEGGGSLAVVVHDTHDPDPVVSAAALSLIAESLGVDTDIVNYGHSGHGGNGYLNLLDIEVLGEDEAELGSYDTIALLDHIADFDEPEFEIDIFIDHVESPDIDAEYVDVRPNVGSNSTIITKYIQELGLDIPMEIATGLLYGIRNETMYFRHDIGPADLTAAAYLYPFADQELLEQLEAPSMSPEELDVLADSINNREVRGSYLVTNVGFITDTETLREAAEHLLNLEGINTALVFGIADETIHIAGMSKDVRVDVAGEIDQHMDESAEVVGHSNEASATIPLGIFAAVEDEDDERETLIDLVDEAITKKILSSMGVDEEE